MTSSDKLNTSKISSPGHLDFSKISPTAKMVAYFREFSDIPFAKDISNLIKAKSITEKICPDPVMLEDLKRFVAPALEARYKSMMSAIKLSGISQVLELASGVSFRGLLMSEDPNITYVETDLEPLMQEKMALIRKLPAMDATLTRPNLFFESVNAVSMQDLEKAVRHFNPKKPIAVVHEGLYMYLSRQEKKALALNIKRLLERFGGVWITPDFMLESASQELLNHPKAKSMMDQMTRSIAELTARNLRDDQFRDEKDLDQFFRGLGFTLTVHPQIDSSYELSSLRKTPLPKEHLDRLSQALQLWVLKLA